MTARWSLGLHGGAGAMRSMGADREAAYREGLHTALAAGAEVLRQGGPATVAVIATISAMESSGAFNAGLGSCLNADGRVEADAAVMDGADLSLGAVAAVPDLGNAVHLAEAIRRASPHCVLAGEGARRFGQSQGLKLVQAEPTEDRLARHRQMTVGMGQVGRDADLTRLGGTHDDGDTVGAVALDAEGHIATAVSTGGLWLKHPGRVGDSPLPGAGFWAEDQVGASGATGTGEFIIRGLLCVEVTGRLRAGQSALEAAQGALGGFSRRFGWGKAGLIAVDGQGRLAFPFDTEGMGRAGLVAGGDPQVAVWPDEGLLSLG